MSFLIQQGMYCFENCLSKYLGLCPLLPPTSLHLVLTHHLLCALQTLPCCPNLSAVAGLHSEPPASTNTGRERRGARGGQPTQGRMHWPRRGPGGRREKQLGSEPRPLQACCSPKALVTEADPSLMMDCYQQGVVKVSLFSFL